MTVDPLNFGHEYMMREALKEANLALKEGEVPVGAVIVIGNRIIGRGHNQVEALQDPTAHAEMIALTAATHTIDKKWLTDATMYVTIEPCIMCAGAMVLARLKRLVYGAAELKTGAHSSIYNLLNDPRTNHRVDVIPGLLKDECGYLMGLFFEKIRKQN
jgi:tRNA(adenine34) deaminase